MRIAEIRARENLDAILATTLSAAWSRLYATGIEVAHRPAPSRRGQGGVQRWYVHDLLSVIITREADREARRWAADAFRYTPRRLRAPAQWLLGTAAATRPGVRVGTRPAFAASPGVPDARSVIVVPGNRRVRLIDLASSRTYSVCKHGFDAEPLRVEAALRRAWQGPFVPVLELVDEPGVTWLEEPLIDGWSLPRCPPHVDRHAAERAALTRLATWLEHTREPDQARARAESLVEQIAAELGRVDARFATALRSRLRPTLDGLLERASALGAIHTALSHGDLQGGNVMVRRSAGRRPRVDDVVLIDWEYAARRFEAYDALCYGLAARAREGLAERITRFVEHGVGALVPTEAALLLSGEHASRAWRLGAAALFLLEDLAWLSADVANAPLVRMSQPLLTLVDELTRFGPRAMALR